MSDDDFSCDEPKPCGHCIALRLFMLTKDIRHMRGKPAYMLFSIASDFSSTFFAILARESLRRYEERAEQTATDLTARAIQSTDDGTNKK